MPQSLILITLGPVQDFIASARRTRDLWFGSHMLSELSRAAARALHERGADLIMPAIDHEAQLRLQLSPLDDKDQPVFNVANKILAILPQGQDPAAAAAAARQAARDALLYFAQHVRQQHGGLLAPGREQAWQEQLDTFLEFLAAWIELTEIDYDQARQTLEAEVAARKNLRAYVPWRYAGQGIPKSSLDGARASVLRDDAHEHPQGRRLRLSRGEQLDAIGLIKRAGGKPEQFVPLVNVTLAAWFEHAEQVAPAPLQQLREQCHALGLDFVHRKDLPWLARFPYDGHLMSKDRHPILLEELRATRGEADAPRAQDLIKTARELLRRAKAPSPYVACLVADGDRMGVALDKLKTPEAHRSFSSYLANFATQARHIVEQQCRGMLVYAGGDDVLAFVCLSDAARCAQLLAQAFARVMQGALPDPTLEQRPTLSVGLGIGHVLESMGYLLELGRRAEKLAKASHLSSASLQRDALAVVLDKRSGGLLQWRQQWSQDPVSQLNQMLAAYGQRLISSKKIYQARDLLRSLPKPSSKPSSTPSSEVWQDESLARLLRMELVRLLSRSHVGLGEQQQVHPAQLGLRLDQAPGSPPSYAALHQHVEDWIARSLLARTLYEAIPAEELARPALRAASDLSASTPEATR